MHQQAHTWRVEAAPPEAAARSQQLARPHLKDGTLQVAQKLEVSEAAQNANNGICALRVKGLKDPIRNGRGGKACLSCFEISTDGQMDVEAAGLRMRMLVALHCF